MRYLHKLNDISLGNAYIRFTFHASDALMFLDLAPACESDTHGKHFSAPGMARYVFDFRRPFRQPDKTAVNNRRRT